MVEENIVLTMQCRQVLQLSLQLRIALALVIKDSLYYTFHIDDIHTKQGGGSLKCQQVMFHDVGHILQAESYK